MGMALTSCTVPHAGQPTFDLPEDEMEIGVGIHGEPGRTRMALKSADEITEMLTLPIIKDLPFEKGDKVIAMVNGMGGTPLIELYIVYRKLAEICEAHGITIARNLSATTSPRWRWPAAPSPCSRPTTRSWATGMRRSRPRGCAGACKMSKQVDK